LFNKFDSISAAWKLLGLLATLDYAYMIKKRLALHQKYVPAFSILTFPPLQFWSLVLQSRVFWSCSLVPPFSVRVFSLPEN